MCTDLANDSSVDVSLVEHIESITKKQHRSPLWKDIRVGRITSSQFHQVLSRKDTTPADGLLKSIMGYSTIPRTAAMQWEISHEATALAAYLKQVNNGFPEDIAIRHTPAGITLYPEYSFLGASSDGLIHDPASPNPNGLIEIKCPVSIEARQSPACRQLIFPESLETSSASK